MQADLPLIPTPQQVHRMPGAFDLRGPLTIQQLPAAPVDADSALALLAPRLAWATGSAPTYEAGGRARFVLEHVGAEALPAADGYELSIDPAQLVLRAATSVGFLHGAQTLRQLLPAACEALDGAAGADVSLPCVQITDAPRFGWRGLHVDVARHLFPLDALLRLVDTMALHKLNRLHWHLTDDQGWRLEINARPRLTDVGAWRAESPTRGARTEGDGIPYGGFYTQTEVRELVAHAASRGITIVPEIELPGHAQAALAAYPELGHGAAPEVWTRWGVSERIFNLQDETFAFFDGVFAEVAHLFPGAYVHVGGDEVPTTEWDASETAQARIQAEGLADTAALQGWFLGRIAAILKRRGRRPVAWDEVLGSGAPADTVVMAWRDTAFARKAAAAGHDVIACPMSCCYFDHYQGPPESEPEAIGGHTDVRKVLAFEPLGEDWTDAERTHLLGVQGNLWSEYIHDAKHLEYMAWPRASALAEVAWSPRGPRDPAGFEARWKHMAERLDLLGVSYREVSA